MELLPVLSPETQWLIRSGYGLLLMLTLLLSLSPGIWFFRGQKWGGYGDESPTTEALHNPFSHYLVMGLWLSCAWMLMLGRETVLFAAINLGLCWYYFVHMRWRGLVRGMGAPGFFCYWMGALVMFLEAGRHLDPSGRVLTAAVLVFQVDYALIQMCAGSYKSVCGYANNKGMQLGMVNPFWGHHYRFFKNWAPEHPVFRFLNHSAFRVQIVAALLMLFPPTRWWGALMIAGSFLFVLTQIRLAFLCPMVILSALLFLPAGSLVDRLIGEVGQVQQSLPPLSSSAALTVTGGLLLYLLILPLAKFCQWYNFLEGKRLAEPYQSFLENWCNFFGIIIWRVFSVDVVNFFVRIYVRDADGLEDEYTAFGRFTQRSRGRYLHVGEFITLTCIFTALKYHPHLFREKLLRYAATVGCPRGGLVRFAHFAIEEDTDSYRYEQLADYLVDPDGGRLDALIYGEPPVTDSPVREGRKPGSYLPSEPRSPVGNHQAG